MPSRKGRPSGRRTLRLALATALTACAAALLVACGGGDNRVRSVSYAAPAYTDWPVFGRDQNGTFYAPQAQINAKTINRLGVAWSTDLGPNQYLAEGYPIMVDNTLYVTTSSNEVQAYNAVTGKRLWRYAPNVDFSQSTGVGGYGVSVNRGVAVSDGKVFALTFDARLKAVSAQTGEELWSSTVTDPSTGAYETMAPRVYDGLVYVGVSGSQDGVRGFIAAYDAQTGKQVWRFYTVPRAGTGWVPPGGGGGGVYMPPTVDTETGLVYAGTGPPSPVLYGEGRKGDNLYTSSVIALNARTGKLVWHYQEVPHDVWNYGAASPVMIVPANVDGREVRAVAQAGKDGRVYILNARTGRRLFAPTPYVEIHQPPPTTQGTRVCPGAIGGSPYSPMALNPRVGAVFVSGVNICQILRVDLTTKGGEQGFAGVRITPRGEPKTGTFSAVDLTTGKLRWQRNMPTPMIGGAVATGADLVFTGDQDGVLYALNARTGETVWQGNLGLAFGSAPIVYTVGDVEYVAVLIGGGAATAANDLGRIGAKLVVLKLDGKPLPR